MGEKGEREGDERGEDIYIYKKKGKRGRKGVGKRQARVRINL